MVYITGDKHGDFYSLIQYTKIMRLKKSDIMVVLGDASLNYFNDERDDVLKQEVSKASCTFLCIHGNHEMRPWHNEHNKRVEWNKGFVYMDLLYPNILYAEDGSIFNIQGRTFLVLGGAYSIDKEYRLLYGYKWFDDEQPSQEIKAYCEKNIALANWNVDYVLSHTCPLKYVPEKVFLKGYDQSKVDKSTELWLDSIENKLTYERWYFGHFHTFIMEKKYTVLFNEVDTKHFRKNAI